MSLEANQRLVGTSAVFLGVVPHASELLFAVDGQDDRIEIEPEGGSPSEQGKELSTPWIGQADELTDGARTHPFEESAQGRRVGERREARQGQEGTVGRPNLGLVDAPQAGHDSVEQSQDEVGGMIVGVGLRHPQGLLQQAAKSQPVAKTLPQDHSAEVSEMGLAEGETKALGIVVGRRDGAFSFAHKHN